MNSRALRFGKHLHGHIRESGGGAYIVASGDWE